MGHTITLFQPTTSVTPGISHPVPRIGRYSAALNSPLKVLLPNGHLLLCFLTISTEAEIPGEGFAFKDWDKRTCWVFQLPDLLSAMVPSDFQLPCFIFSLNSIPQEHLYAIWKKLPGLCRRELRLADFTVTCVLKTYGLQYFLLLFNYL